MEYFSLAGAGKLKFSYQLIRNGGSDDRLRLFSSSLESRGARRGELFQCPERNQVSIEPDVSVWERH